MVSLGWKETMENITFTFGMIIGTLLVLGVQFIQQQKWYKKLVFKLIIPPYIYNIVYPKKEQKFR